MEDNRRHELCTRQDDSSDCRIELSHKLLHRKRNDPPECSDAEQLRAGHSVQLRCNLARVRCRSRHRCFRLHAVQLLVGGQAGHCLDFNYLLGLSIYICSPDWPHHGAHCKILRAAGHQAEPGVLEEDGHGDVQHRQISSENQRHSSVSWTDAFS